MLYRLSRCFLIFFSSANCKPLLLIPQQEKSLPEEGKARKGRTQSLKDIEFTFAQGGDKATDSRIPLRTGQATKAAGYLSFAITYVVSANKVDWRKREHAKMQCSQRVLAVFEIPITPVPPNVIGSTSIIPQPS